MRAKLRDLLLSSCTNGKIRGWLEAWGYDVVPRRARDPAEPLHNHLTEVFSALKINCVLDVGANKGQYALRLRRYGYTGHVISFEPVRANFEILNRNCGQDALWRGLDFALGSTDCSSEIQVTQQSVFSSFLHPNAFSKSRFREGSSVISTETVTIRRLDSIIDDLTNGIEQPRIFLKMDTQGFDLEVLRGAEGSLDKILGLQTEISIMPIYEQMPSHIEMLSELQGRQYVVTGMFPINPDELLRPVEFDCIAVRADR